MPLTRAAIEELKAIYRRKSGKDLSDDEAWEMGNRLIRFFTVMTRPPVQDASDGYPKSAHVARRRLDPLP